MKKVLAIITIISFISCEKPNVNPHLVLEFSNDEVHNIINYEVYVDDYNGMYISLEDSLYRNIWDKNIESIFFTKDDKRYDIVLYKILYSAKDVPKCQSPVTPKGKLAFFNICGKPMFPIDCRRQPGFIKEFEVKTCDE